GGGGVVADAGKRAQRHFVRREFPAMALHHGAGTGMEMARPRVIAQALPGMENILERRRGKRAEIGPARHETVKMASYGRHRRLLQHDFAEPDAIGVGTLARQRAPGQVTAMAVVPVEQALRQIARLDRGRGGRSLSGARFGTGHSTDAAKATTMARGSE